MKVLDPILWSNHNYSTPLQPNHRRHTFTTAAAVCLGCGLSLNITCETCNLHWALRVTCTIEMFVIFAHSCLFLASQYPSEFYVACCAAVICTEMAVCFWPVNTHANAMLHVVLWVFENSCFFLAGQYPSEFYVACCVAGVCK